MNLGLIFYMQKISARGRQVTRMLPLQNKAENQGKTEKYLILLYNEHHTAKRGTHLSSLEEGLFVTTFFLPM